jgi:uncharacterized Tic20 family protein
LIAGAGLFLLAVITCGLAVWLVAVLAGLLGLANLIFTIVGAVKANEGQRWTYPFSIRLVS